MYLTIAETAEYLEVSESYVEKLIQQKRFVTYLTGILSHLSRAVSNAFKAARAI